MNRSFKFAFALGAVFISVSAAHAQSKPQVTFGVDAAPTVAVSKFDSTPNPVSSTVQVGDDYGTVSMRYMLKVAMNKRHSTQVSLRRDSYGDPSSWYRSVDRAGKVPITPPEPSLSSSVWERKTRNTVIDLQHRLSLGRGFTAIAGLTHMMFTQDVDVTMRNDNSLSRMEYDYSFTGPVGGVAYSRQVKWAMLFGEATVGALHQNGTYHFQHRYPGPTAVLTSDTYNNSIWSFQHQWTIGSEFKVTEHVGFSMAFAFRGVRTGDGYYVYYREYPNFERSKNPSHFNTGSLMFGLRVRP
jgi:hypothetical protein